MKKLIISLVVIAVVAAGLIFFFWDGEFLSKKDQKIYSNESLGFEIKYSEKWRNEECVYQGFGIVGFGDSAQPLLICNSDAPPLSYINVQVGGPAAQFDLLIKNLQDNLDNFSKENTTLDGRPAVKIYGETRPSEGPGLPAGVKMTMISAKEKGKVYSVSHWNLENEDHLRAYEQMVSSFKFLGEDVVCIQVITPARNLQTGERKDFPTPCDVPEGWEIVQ